MESREAMTKERIYKELGKVRGQIAQLQAKEKELEEQRQLSEDAEAKKIIKKYKISSEKLMLLNRISEDEILSLLKGKEKEDVENEQKMDG